MASEKRNSMMLGLLFLGLALVGISFYWSSRQNTPQVANTIADVTLELGNALVLRPNSLNPQVLDRRIHLGNLDSVQTEDTGEALITFANGARVRVSPASLVTIEEDNKGVFVLILKQGNVQIESPGPERSLVISQNGERIAAEVYNSTRSVMPDGSRPSKVSEKAVDTLSAEEISHTMTRQKNTFYKCYTQLLQKDAKAHGSVSLSFTVENTGKVQNAEVTTSDFSEPSFKRCLVEVMKRIEFRNFQGNPVSTLFPIRFE